MNKKFFGFLLAISVGALACNDDADNTAANDTTGTTTETTTTSTTTDYAAMGEEFKSASEAGNFLEPRTGKPIRIAVEPKTGVRVNAETGEPVWRYVDRRTWWLYGGDNWDKIGEVKMDGSTLKYKADNDTWVTYEERWPNDDAEQKEWKEKIGDIKYKVSEDGDIKIKNKETGEKIKYDADDNKIKVDSSR